MSKRRRGTRARPAPPARPPGLAAGEPTTQPVRPKGVRPKGPRRKGPPPRRGLSGVAIGVGLAGGLAIVAIGYLALTSFNAATASPSPGSPTRGPVGENCPTSQPDPLPAGETRTVTIRTDLGTIVIKVDGDLSPIAAGNFAALADCGYYDGVVFHRTATMQDGTPFVIQGGDPTGSGSGGPGYTIQDEPVTTQYRRGTVAMARTPAPNSQGSQFFIVLDDRAEPPLVSANTYAIFGEVISGMEVADAIHQASGGVQLPTDPVVMTDVSVASP